MKTGQRKTVVSMSFMTLIWVLLAPLFAVAGDLEPPAAPGPTMKTLDEVEPRIPIPASATATTPFAIDKSGSYYLTGDRVASGNGINVNADHVTIDLMGHSLIGPGAVNNFGIYMFDRDNVEIRNGTVRNFGYGIYEGYLGASHHRIIGVRALENKVAGIHLLGSEQMVSSCIVANNTGSKGGISIGYNSLVTGNVVRSNQGVGISAGVASIVSGNTVSYSFYDGIHASQNSIVTGNTLEKNNSSNMAVRAGIRFTNGCLVKNNILRENNQNNIYVSETDCVIEGNLVVNSTNGIYFATTGNFYANNRASGNITNYAGSVPTGSGDGGGNAEF